MIFNNIFDDVLEGKEVYRKINVREAVRAVIFRDDKILLVHSNKGDYKFPGGGVEKEENHSVALKREVAEETGYRHCHIKEKLGKIIERSVDTYEAGAIFEMHSHYYLCELLNDEQVMQQLDDYEAEQGFKSSWVSLDEAIKENENVLKQTGYNDWVKRELFVLQQVKKFTETKKK